METGRLKQGAAGDAPGGGRLPVRRFAPRLPVTCPDFTTPRPITLSLSRALSLSLVHLEAILSFSFDFFLFFRSRRLRYFGTLVRLRHNKWQYVKNVNALCIERARASLNDRVKIHDKFSKCSNSDLYIKELQYNVINLFIII